MLFYIVLINQLIVIKVFYTVTLPVLKDIWELFVKLVIYMVNIQKQAKNIQFHHLIIVEPVTVLLPIS